jgi:hypothetical protein
MTIEWSKHDKNDPLYIDEKFRQCVGCDAGSNIRPLSEFPLKHRATGALRGSMCRKCQKAEIEWHAENGQDAAIDLLTTTLSKVSNARKLGQQGYSDALENVCKAIGGQNRAFFLAGKALSKSLRRGLKRDAAPHELDRSVRVAETLLKSAAAHEKLKGPPVDLSSLSEDDVIQILSGPAKQVLLSDKEFRKQLLSDPDVRRLILADMGKDLIDVEAEVTDG